MLKDFNLKKAYVKVYENRLEIQYKGIINTIFRGLSGKYMLYLNKFEEVALYENTKVLMFSKKHYIRYKKKEKGEIIILLNYINSLIK